MCVQLDFQRSEMSSVTFSDAAGPWSKPGAEFPSRLSTEPGAERLEISGSRRGRSLGGFSLYLDTIRVIDARYDIRDVLN